VGSPAGEQAGVLGAVEGILRELLGELKKKGLEAGIVSGGSTPTGMQSDLVKSLTEIRPGTYIYNDRNTLAGGWCGVGDCAARIIATVVSEAVPGKVVVDAGTKVLTSDRLGKDPEGGGFGLLVDYPVAKVSRLSEEHGEILVGEGRRPRLGERVAILPNHICPCINLRDEVWVREESGELREMVVDARGCVV
jgi:D-serine deaminase-like pyridoxal phosphate-dependent protein